MDAEIAQQLQAQFQHEHRQSDTSFAPASPDLRRRRGRRYWGGRVVLNGLVDPVGFDAPSEADDGAVSHKELIDPAGLQRAFMSTFCLYPEGPELVQRLFHEAPVKLATPQVQLMASHAYPTGGLSPGVPRSPRRDPEP